MVSRSSACMQSEHSECAPRMTCTQRLDSKERSISKVGNQLMYCVQAFRAAKVGAKKRKRFGLHQGWPLDAKSLLCLCCVNKW